MTLQQFNPDDIDNSTPVVPSEMVEQTAKQLFAELVEEAKQPSDGGHNPGNPSSPLELAQQMLQQLSSFRESQLKIKDFKAGKTILGCSPNVQVAIVGDAISRLVNDRHTDTLADQLSHNLLKSLLRKSLPYQGSDISRILKLVVTDSITGVYLPVNSIMSNVERFVAEHELPQSAKHTLKKLAKTFHPNAWTADERKIGEKIKSILGAPSRNKTSDPEDQALSVSNQSEEPSINFEINTGEAWTDALLVELGKLNEESRRDWRELLDQCETASASKPSK